MLVMGYYHYPCQDVISFISVWLDKGEQIWDSYADKICQLKPIFGLDSAHP